MPKTAWPKGVTVGHTLSGHAEGERRVILECPRRSMTTDEARAVARSLLLRADFLDRTPDTHAGPDGIPRRRDPEPEQPTPRNARRICVAAHALVSASSSHPLRGWRVEDGALDRFLDDVGAVSPEDAVDDDE